MARLYRGGDGDGSGLPGQVGGPGISGQGLERESLLH